MPSLKKLLAPGWRIPGNQRACPLVSFQSVRVRALTHVVAMATWQPNPRCPGDQRGWVHSSKRYPAQVFSVWRRPCISSACGQKGETGHLVADSTQKGKGLEKPHHSFLFMEEFHLFRVKVHKGFTSGQA